MGFANSKISRSHVYVGLTNQEVSFSVMWLLIQQPSVTFYVTSLYYSFPDPNVSVLSKQAFQFHFCVSSIIQTGLVVRKPVFGFVIWYCLFQVACLAACSKFSYHSKTCLKRPLSKIPKIGFQDQLLLHAGQKYCSILQYLRPSLSYHLSSRSLLSPYEVGGI